MGKRPPPVKDVEFCGSATAVKHYPKRMFPSVAFVGRSNVGKSSLINTLVQRKRLAFTSNTPGRTQTLNFYLINKDFYFVDLPGYGFARAPKSVQAQWGPMVEEYLSSDYAPEVVVLVLDLRRDLSEGDRLLMSLVYDNNIPMIAAMTKRDTVKSSQRLNREKVLEREINSIDAGWTAGPFVLSAKTGEGRDELWRTLLDEVARD